MSSNLYALMQAMQRWMDAKGEHDIAYSKFEGFSWDYYGKNFIEAVEDAEKDVEENLQKYVDARIKHILKRQSKENKK